MGAAVPSSSSSSSIASRPRVVSVVNGPDLVPRLSRRAAEELRDVLRYLSEDEVRYRTYNELCGASTAFHAGLV